MSDAGAEHWGIITHSASEAEKALIRVGGSGMMHKFSLFNSGIKRHELAEEVMEAFVLPAP